MRDVRFEEFAAFRARLTRRRLLKAGLFGAAGLVACRDRQTGPSSIPESELRWLGWQHYDVPALREAFETEFGVRVSAGYFDGNSEAYSRLKTGGTEDFDLVMADGFWPRLYYEQGLTQAIDESRLTTLGGVFPDFLRPKYELLHTPSGDTRVAAPNCWGGYGVTANVDRIAPEDLSTLGVLFNDAYEGRLSTSARFEENIALAGILACHQLGTIGESRPDGDRFNPYKLWDHELEAAKELLIRQKGLLLARWNDEDTLERLLRSESVWASPEWSGIYRRIHFDRLDGKTNLNMEHILRPTEGGLGWVDTWAITSGVQDPEKIELAHKWIEFRLRPENMALVAIEIGWSPTVDVRDRIPGRYRETLFLDNTAAIADLYQFDVPSSTEKWEAVWSEVEAS